MQIEHIELQVSIYAEIKKRDTGRNDRLEVVVIEKLFCDNVS